MTGQPYINIGTEKSCLFVHMSSFLCKNLKARPLLYYAIEEGLVCSKLGYHAAGILAMSQLLKVMNTGTPAARHDVAHEILQKRPLKADFDQILQRVKDTAKAIHEGERKKHKDSVAYWEKLLVEWVELRTSRHAPD